MNFDLEQSLAQLARTPAAVDALLRGAGKEWTSSGEGAGTWSAYDVVGHLIHAEEDDWVPRARMILKHGERRPFEPFDREAMFTKFAGWPLERLLDRFAEARRESLATVRSWDLTAAQLAMTGRHPELGRVTLAQLLSTWTVHDFGHLAQICRVMAKVYGAEVGPWRQYLPVLTR